MKDYTVHILYYIYFTCLVYIIYCNIYCILNITYYILDILNMFKIVYIYIYYFIIFCYLFLYYIIFSHNILY